MVGGSLLYIIVAIVVLLVVVLLLVIWTSSQLRKVGGQRQPASIAATASLDEETADRGQRLASGGDGSPGSPDAPDARRTETVGLPEISDRLARSERPNLMESAQGSAWPDVSLRRVDPMAAAEGEATIGPQSAAEPDGRGASAVWPVGPFSEDQLDLGEEYDIQAQLRAIHAAAQRAAGNSGTSVAAGAGGGLETEAATSVAAGAALETGTAKGPDEAFAEHLPPLVLEQSEAEDMMSGLDEDGVVRLSAYEARSRQALKAREDESSEDGRPGALEQRPSGVYVQPAADSQRTQGEPLVTANAPAGVRMLEELPDWLIGRLQHDTVLGWFVLLPDGFSPASDQVYDPVVLEQFGALVSVGRISAETVGLETPSEITLRGAEGAIGAYPLQGLGLAQEGWLVIFFSEPTLSANWSQMLGLGDGS